MSTHLMERWKIANQSGITCKNCGAAKHGGYWFLSGFKSKAEPKCNFEDFELWKENAIEVEL